MKYFTRDEVERIGRAGVRSEQHPDGILCRIMSSCWLWCESDDKAFTPWMKSDGFWEAWITKWMSEQFDGVDRFIDVGANVGYYTMLAAASNVPNVAAIEPNPRVRGLLEKSLDTNRFSDVSVIENAMSNRSGKGNIVIPLGHSGGAYVGIGEPDMESVAISISTLDKEFSDVSDEKILIKIDAEGLEPKIWAGMKKLRERNDVITILEWDGRRYDGKKFAEDLYTNSVYLVDYDGSEVPLEESRLLSMTGLHMVVVR